MDGGFMIDSFFDIFTEVSLDGGQSSADPIGELAKVFPKRLATLDARQSAQESARQLAWLADAVVMSVIGAFYYLRVVKLMYFDEPMADGPVESKLAFRVLLSVNGITILAVGLYPGVLLRLCEFVIP